MKMYRPYLRPAGIPVNKQVLFFPKQATIAITEETEPVFQRIAVNVAPGGPYEGCYQ